MGKKKTQTHKASTKNTLQTGVGEGGKLKFREKTNKQTKKKTKKIENSSRHHFPFSISILPEIKKPSVFFFFFFFFFFLKLMFWFSISSLALALGGASAALPTIPADGRGAAGTGFVRLTTAAYPGGGNGDVMRGGTEPAGVGYVEENYFF
jgi:hypothetical protein